MVAPFFIFFPFRSFSIVHRDNDNCEPTCDVLCDVLRDVHYSLRRATQLEDVNVERAFRMRKFVSNLGGNSFSAIRVIYVHTRTHAASVNICE